MKKEKLYLLLGLVVLAHIVAFQAFDATFPQVGEWVKENAILALVVSLGYIVYAFKTLGGNSV